MLRYAVKRLLMTVPVFFGASLLIFLAVFALPGDPVRALGGYRTLPEATVEAIEERYYLDRSIAHQYAAYMGNLLGGDLGESYVSRRPVRDILAETFPNTVRLAVLTLGLEIVIGLGAGVVAAITRRSFLDTLVLVASALAVSIPLFVLGFVLQWLLGVRWKVLPVAGLESGMASYLLPAFTLASVSLAYVARLTRSSVVEALHEDYVRTARSKGLSEARVVGHHALRPSLLPVVTFLGIDFGALLGGAVVVEAIFNINGVGNAVYQAITLRDNLVVIGFTVAAVAVFLLVNLVVDLLYAVLDPRVRYD